MIYADGFLGLKKAIRNMCHVFQRLLPLLSNFPFPKQERRNVESALVQLSL